MSSRPSGVREAPSSRLEEVPPDPREITILGTKLSLCSRDELLEVLEERIERRRKTMVLSGNIHSFNLSFENRWYRELFNRADLVHIDGAGLRLGAWILGYRTPPRTTWADFVWTLARFCAERHWSLYLLGGRPGVAQRAADRLIRHAPGLRISGTGHGYFDKSPGPENSAVLHRIHQASPEVLLLGFGMPIQERWLADNWHRLDVTVALTGGAVFDWVAGELHRGPKWMVDYGFEWLARLLAEPRRLWRRYLLGNPKFLYRILKERLGHGRPTT